MGQATVTRDDHQPGWRSLRRPGQGQPSRTGRDAPEDRGLGSANELGLTYVFISHDLGMVRHISNRIAVMYLGQIVELGGWQAVSDAPLHPYTRSLRDAVPVPDPELESQRLITPLRGEVPDAVNPPAGCRFNPRCPFAEDRCRDEVPLLREITPNHHAACHFSEQLYAGELPA